MVDYRGNYFCMGQPCTRPTEEERCLPRGKVGFNMTISAILSEANGFRRDAFAGPVPLAFFAGAMLPAFGVTSNEP